ncbi:hypothetical protein [Halomonas salipaludis]|uniref:Uncharacterized protein n=1 Tax=Halomonas salipaludis TaxID=2032625 RepID=A0A2A2ENW8_9GAMM|nr:hypothetical protein [Halomonas salipaludis]PAU74358.1 hypothetical protein CK498_22705 [Halomonas salipaludis]
MTPKEIQAQILNHWWTQHRRQASKLGPEQNQRQSMALARITRSEMDSLIAIGLDERTAWSEASRLALVPPPTSEDIAADPDQMPTPEPTAPDFSKNRIFTAEMAEQARARLKRMLGQ